MTAIGSIVALTMAAVSATVSAGITARPPAPTPVARRAIADPVTRFTLPNGLKVVVQTNRRLPLVAATVVYDVGSKDERAGQFGYAHLFEHLALDGSEHWNQGALRSLQDMGATNVNAMTTQDTTVFVETFPRAALERVLFLEADRMGYIGAALTPERIRREVGVVLNEKRERAGQPFGGLDDVLLGDLYPADHPYHHSVIGDDADLNAVTVERARAWFDTYYGPSNATLILAGDVTAEEARTLVMRYFGGLSPRLPVDRLTARAVTLPGPVRRQMYAAVPQARLNIVYHAPPAGTPAMAMLDLCAQILANGARSRLPRRLVEERGLASSVFVTFDEGQLSSGVGFVVQVAAPERMAEVEAEAEAVLARFVAEGPTTAELESARAARVRYLMSMQESTAGKAFLLARGARQRRSDDYAQEYLEALLTATPESVRRVAAEVYGRPGYHLAVLPRPALTATPGGYDPAKGPPAMGAITPIAFPAVEQARLSNGLRVMLVPRAGATADTMLLRFDGGGSAGAGREVAPIAIGLLAASGTTPGEAMARERLGTLDGWVSGTVEADHADLLYQFDATRLAPGIALFGEMVTRREVAPDALATAKRVRIDRLKGEPANPNAAAERALYVAIYGAGHPYAPAATPAEAIRQVEAVDAATLREWRRAHLRPDRATLYVAADTDLATLTPMLDAALRGWTAEGAAAPATPIPPARGRPAPSLTVIDRPGATQTYIIAGKILPPGDGNGDALHVANEVYGGNFTSRIGSNLRGEKGWTYGIGSGVYDTRGERRWIIAGTVDRDHSGASIAELGREMRALTGEHPPEQAELDRIVTTAANGNAAKIENNVELLTAMADARARGLPHDDVVRQPPRLRALTPVHVTQASAALADPRSVHWVLVGDWQAIRDQFGAEKLGQPEVIAPAH